MNSDESEKVGLFQLEEEEEEEEFIIEKYMKLEMHGKAQRIARSAPQCRPLANTCEKHLLTDHLSV